MTEYSISAPALHAARTILKHFDVREKSESQIEFSEQNLARLIDRYTYSWRIKDAVKELTRHVSWLPNHQNNVEHSLDKLRHSVEALELIDKKIPRYEDEVDQPFNFKDLNGDRNRAEAHARAPVYEISAASVYAIRMIQEHYEFIERPDGQVDCTEYNLADIVDISTNIFDVQDKLHRMCAMVRTLTDQELLANMKTVRNVLAALDIACARMPGYGEPKKLRVIQQRPEQQAVELSHEQKRQRAMVSTALHRTRNPQDALRVINAARSDRLI